MEFSLFILNRSGYAIGLCGAGGRFSKSPQEREHMLAQRKNALLTQARRRFVTKAKADTGDDEVELSCDVDCVENS